MADLLEIVRSHASPEFILSLCEKHMGQHKDLGPNSKMFKCPFHEDGTPSLSVDPMNMGMFQCFGCGEKGNIFSILTYYGIETPLLHIARLLNVDATSAQVEQIASRDVDIKTSATIAEPKKIIDPGHIMFAKEYLLERPALLKKMNDLGISTTVIEELHIGYTPKDITAPGQRHRFMFPIQDETGDFVNIRFYDPDAKSKGPDHPKIISYSEVIERDDQKIKVTGWGKAKLYPLSALKEDTIYFCEGEKDMLTGRSYGLNTITVAGGATTWVEAWGPMFQDKTVIIVPDIDEPGIKGGRKKAQFILQHTPKVKLINLPIDPVQIPKGDLNDYFIKLEHTKEEFLELVDRTAWYPGGSVEHAAEPDRPQEPAHKKEQGARPGDPLDISRFLIDDLDLMFVPELSSVYKYDATKCHWVAVDDEELQYHSCEYLKKNSKGKVTVKKVRDIMFFMRTYSAMMNSAEELNKQRNRLNLANGVYDMTTHMLMPHDKANFFTHIIPLTYDQKAECPLWEKTVTTTFENDKQKIKIMQEIMGYCLTTDTKQQKAFLLYGTGSNGKSVMIKTLISLLGKENYSSVPFHELSRPFSRALLQNKLLNIGTEIDYDDETATSSFKEIVTGDPIHADVKYKPQITFNPFCKMMYATNDLPNVRDKSKGYYRRLLILPFTKVFEGENDDKDLQKKLEAERSGILNWCIEGLKRLQEQGEFTFCQAAQDLLDTYIYNSNPLLLFVKDKCVIKPEGLIARSVFIKGFHEYCKDNGYKSYSTQRAIKILTDHLKLATRKSHGEIIIEGIELCPQGQDNDRPLFDTERF